jgi:hypothetical protein
MCITFSMAILVIFGALRPNADEQSASQEDDSQSLANSATAGKFVLAAGAN